MNSREGGSSINQEQYWKEMNNNEKRTNTKKITITNTKEKGGNSIHPELNQRKEY
jgi:hypothetical protein